MSHCTRTTPVEARGHSPFVPPAACGPPAPTRASPVRLALQAEPARSAPRSPRPPSGGGPRHAVTYAPCSRGVSCHRQPVRSTYRIPAMTFRSSTRGRPTCPWGSRRGSILFHCWSRRVRWASSCSPLRQNCHQAWLPPPNGNASDDVPPCPLARLPHSAQIWTRPEEALWDHLAACSLKKIGGGSGTGALLAALAARGSEGMETFDRRFRGPGNRRSTWSWNLSRAPLGILFQRRPLFYSGR